MATEATKTEMEKSDDYVKQFETDNRLEARPPKLI